MTILARTRRQSVQPQFAPRINWNHPLARGLTHALLPSVMPGSCWDAVTSQMVVSASSRSVKMGTPGMGVKYGDAAGANSLTIPFTTEINAGAVFWLGERHASGPAIFRTDEITTSVDTLVWDDGANHFNARLGGVTASAVGSFPQDAPVNFLITGDNVDGLFCSNGARTAAIAGTWSGHYTTSVNFCLHRNSTFGQGVSATDYLWLIWNRRISLGEYYVLNANPWQVFNAPSYLPVLAASISGAQLLVPASDITAGQWLPSTGGVLATTIDESPADDADYVYTLAQGAVCEVKLGAGSTPGAGSFVVSYRAMSAYGQPVYVELVQGSTVIASWTDTPTAAFALYTHTLTAPEAASISAFTDLRLRFTSLQ